MNSQFWARGPLDCGLGSDLCTAIWAISSNTPSINIRAINDFMEPSDTFAAYAENGLVPQYGVVYWPGGAAYFFAGTSFAQVQIQGLITGWSNAEGSPVLPGAGVILGNAAWDFWNENIKSNPWTPPGTKFYLAGFSYGGMFAHLLGKVLDRQIDNQTNKVWSFGSPRPCKQQLADYMYPAIHTRWWMQDDPVRYIPPHSDEIPFLTWVLLDNTMQGMNRQVQVGNGISVDANGITALGTGNPGPVDRPVLSLTAWLTGAQGLANVNHTVLTYRNRLALASRNVGNLQPPNAGGLPNDPVIVTNGGLATIRSREEPIVIAAGGNGQLPPVQVVVTQGGGQTPPPPGTVPTRYKLKKVGRIWTVQLSGEIVAIGPGKRRAKQIRRTMNRMLTSVSL